MSQHKVVIGTWPLSGDFGHVDLTTVDQTIHRALELGFHEFDTAPNYGKGFMEFALGKTLRDHKDVRINTKCGNLPFGGKSFAPADLQASVEQSLKRLQREQIHVLFMHNPRTEVSDWAPIFEMFTNLKKSGKIQKAGVSLAKGFDYAPEVFEFFDVIQDDANLLYLKSPGLTGVVKKEFTARSPLASGLLGGGMTLQTTFAPDDHRSGWLKGDRLASCLKRVKAIETLSGMPVASASRRFLFGHPLISTVIFGVKRPSHLEDIHTDAKLGALPKDLSRALESLYDRDFDLVNERHLGY